MSRMAVHVRDLEGRRGSRIDLEEGGRYLETILYERSRLSGEPGAVHQEPVTARYL